VLIDDHTLVAATAAQLPLRCEDWIAPIKGRLSDDFGESAAALEKNRHRPVMAELRHLTHRIQGGRVR
jgi:hypothetical protein